MREERRGRWMIREGMEGAKVSAVLKAVLEQKGCD